MSEKSTKLEERHLII